MTAEARSQAEHVYASMRDIAGRNAKNAAEMAETSKREGVGHHAIELDVQSEPSIDVAVKKIMAESGKIDVLVHNAGHMMFGPAEAFLPEQFAVQYDVNVLGTQRVSGPVLPHMRAAKQGHLLLWISSSSSAGGTPHTSRPISPPKRRWTRWPSTLWARAVALGHRDDDRRAGRVHQGPEPLRAFRASGRPEARVAGEYEAGPYKGFGEEVLKAFAAIVPDDAEPSGVADEIVEVVDVPFDNRPFRIHYDPTEDAPMSASPCSTACARRCFIGSVSPTC